MGNALPEVGIVTFFEELFDRHNIHPESKNDHKEN